MTSILDNLKTDLHTHTNLSSDASDSLESMVKAAAGKGLKVLAITNHVPEIPGYIWNGIKSQIPNKLGDVYL